MQLTTFDAMQENPMANYSSIPDTIFDRKVSHFLRKGKRAGWIKKETQIYKSRFWLNMPFVFLGEVGDWKNHLSPEENSAFEKHYMETMSDCEIPFRFVI